jgi:endonuclease YncB( thermonuclease family)
MKPFHFICSVFISLLFLSLCVNIFFFISNRQQYAVISVPDGDSIDLIGGQRIRLLGIDAPEHGRCMAQEARNALASRAIGKTVRLKETVKDSYGRTLAIVIIEDFPQWISYLRWQIFYALHKTSQESPDPDPLLNRAMLRSGLARSTGSGGSYNTVFKQAEAKAKAEKRGIFSPVCRQDIPPNTCSIKGNSRDGKKYYYPPECSQYSQVIIDLSYGDTWFCSPYEAAKAGFHISPVCK